MLDLEAFLRLSGNVNPFEIPNGTRSQAGKKDPRVDKLVEVGFTTGFKARLGIPPMTDPSKIPNLVDLSGGIGRVRFNQLCSEFNAVGLLEYKARGASVPWVKNLSQEKDKPWIFQSPVNLDFTTVREGFNSLPDEVQKRIKNVTGSPYDARQLLFNFTNTKLSTQPKLSEDMPRESEIRRFLESVFCSTYFDRLQSGGKPILAVVAPSDQKAPTPTPTLTLTDFNYGISPYVDAAGKTI